MPTTIVIHQPTLESRSVDEPLGRDRPDPALARDLQAKIDFQRDAALLINTILCELAFLGVVSDRWGRDGSRGYRGVLTSQPGQAPPSRQNQIGRRTTRFKCWTYSTRSRLSRSSSSIQRSSAAGSAAADTSIIFASSSDSITRSSILGLDPSSRARTPDAGAQACQVVAPAPGGGLRRSARSSRRRRLGPIVAVQLVGRGDSRSDRRPSSAAASPQ